MTLIAGLPLLQIPCLFGDILVSKEASADGSSDTNITIPTCTDYDSVYPDGAKYVITEFRQKLCKISDNLAIAWAGRRIEASAIVDELIKQSI